MSNQRFASPCRLAAAVSVPLFAIGLVACGGNPQSAAQPSASERAFLQAMVPHHQSAVEMATVARKRAEHPQIRQLATSIVTTQNREIAQMRSIYQRSFGTALKSNPMAHKTLGLSPEEAGMNHMQGGAMLANARPFDRAFIDMMIPHHQGAVRMARAVLARRPGASVRSLANAIITAQSREIGQMNAWRIRWYGAPSPAVGMPAAGHDMHSG